MSEGQPKDQGLVFEYTPLQNLKNILSEVDASAQVNLSEPSVGALQKAVDKEGIVKARIQKTVDDLMGLPGQHLSPLAIEQIVYDLCVKREGAEHKGPSSVFDNEAVAKLESILKNF